VQLCQIRVCKSATRPHVDFVCVSKDIQKPAATPKCSPIFPRHPTMERNDRMGESAPQYPKPAGAQHNIDESCQPPPGTTRSDAQPAPTWEYVDSDIALRRPERARLPACSRRLRRSRSPCNYHCTSRQASQ